MKNHFGRKIRRSEANVIGKFKVSDVCCLRFELEELQSATKLLRHCRPFVLFFSRVSTARKETLILFLKVFSLLQVPTKKIHMYTIIQTLAWAFLFGIKLSPLAPSFPFFIICLIPLRKLLGKFYEEHELEEVS